MKSKAFIANKYFLATVLWSLLLLIATLMPARGIPDYSLLSYDKALHGGVLMIYAFLLSATIFDIRGNMLRSLSWGALISVAYSTALELLQHYIPGRYTDHNDMLANIIGTVTGIFLFFLYRKIRKKAL